MAKCTAEKKDGTACRAWAVRGSDPPLCGAHGGGAARPGAPAGNKNAEKHGAYAAGKSPADLDEAITELERRLKQVSAYIDKHFAELEPPDFGRLAGLQAQMTSRLGRLMRDRQQVTGDDSDELAQAINQALDWLGEEWGVEL